MRLKESDRSEASQCPPWCVATHDEQLHPEDHWHYSVSHAVPVVELESHFANEEWIAHERGQEFELGLEQRIGQHNAYVHVESVESGSRGFRVSVESAERLADAFIELLRVERAR